MSEGSGRCRKRIKCVLQVGSDVTLYIVFASRKYVVKVVGPEESVKMYCCSSHEESAPYFTFDSKEGRHYTQLNYSRVSDAEPLKVFWETLLDIQIIISCVPIPDAQQEGTAMSEIERKRLDPIHRGGPTFNAVNFAFRPESHSSSPPADEARRIAPNRDHLSTQ
jgi:hypothetical protein